MTSYYQVKKMSLSHVSLLHKEKAVIIPWKHFHVKGKRGLSYQFSFLFLDSSIFLKKEKIRNILMYY